MFGVGAVAQNFSPWFFGDGYEKVPILMMIFSPIILVIGFSNVLGIQYLLPLKKDKKYTIAITSGAAINLFLNLILIRLLWSYGAAIATIVAELTVTVIMFIFARKDISFFNTLKATWKNILSGLIMFAAVFTTQYFLKSSILNTLLLVFEGAAIYFGLLLLLRDNLLLLMIKKIFAKFKKKST